MVPEASNSGSVVASARPKGTLKRDVGGGAGPREPRPLFSAPAMWFITRACFSYGNFPSCSPGSLRVSHK